jgi:hypothetical protein
MALIFLQDMRISTVILALTFLARSLPCFGQAGKAELFGAIQDPQGLPVSGAKVTCAQPGHRRAL